jgi:hypothetical protein
VPDPAAQREGEHSFASQWSGGLQPSEALGTLLASASEG